MARSISELKSEVLSVKKTRSTTPKKTPSTSPKGGTITRSISNPQDLAKAAVQALGESQAPQKLTSPSDLKPVTAEAFESESEQISQQINAAKLMQAKAQLQAEMIKAQTALAKNAVGEIGKAAVLQDVEAALAGFESSTERRKSAEAKAMQAKIEREGIEALAPILQQRQQALQNQALIKVQQIEARTAALLNPGQANIIDVEGIEL